MRAAVSDIGITVTFQGAKCHYDGPERVPAGRFRLTLDVRDQAAYDGYAVVAVTLKEGKTREDLVSWTSAYPPPWTHGHGAVLVPRGELGWQEVWLDRAPLFLVCFTGDPGRKTDLLGPIEVEASAPEARQLWERLQIRHPPERSSIGVFEGSVLAARRVPWSTS
jgi:hypothetical protein